VVVDFLEKVFDYECRLEHFNSQQKKLVEKLGGGIKQVVGSRRKCMLSDISQNKL
jgi:hypothetical protein